MTDHQPSPFNLLTAARAEELKGWPLTAALLYEFAENKVKWWDGIADSKKDALASPELQIPMTTYYQYVAVWRHFGAVPVDQLERARPRLLYQAVEAVIAGANPAAVVADAQVLSWSSFIRKYRPGKFPERI